MTVLDTVVLDTGQHVAIQTERSLGVTKFSSALAIDDILRETVIDIVILSINVHRYIMKIHQNLREEPHQSVHIVS